MLLGIHSVLTPHFLVTLMLLTLTTTKTTIRRVSSLSTSSLKMSANKLPSKPLNIHWFRHSDLRLMDHPALNSSIQSNRRTNDKEIKGIVPIFCFDPRLIHGSTQTPFGSQKCQVRRAQFLLQSVHDLRSQLQDKNSGLVVAIGKPEEVIPKLVTAMEAEGELGIQPSVKCQQEVASEELAVEKNLRRELKSRKNKGSLETVWGSTLYDLDDLPFEQGVDGMPDVFTPFRNKMEKVRNSFFGTTTRYSFFFLKLESHSHFLSLPQQYLF